MATKNAISNKTGSLTVDPGASGDSFLQFDINTTGEFRIGVDDTDSDAFVISQGSALGTTNTFRMSAAGERTMPLQPVFSAYTSTLLNVTGDGTVYTILWSNEIFDIGSDYNTGTGTFTASTSGRYRFILNVWISDCDNAAFTSIYTQIVTSNRTYTGCKEDPYIRCTQYGSYGQASFVLSALVDMDAADTCSSKVMVSGHTKTIHVSSVSSAALRGYFMGALIL